MFFTGKNFQNMFFHANLRNHNFGNSVKIYEKANNPAARGSGATAPAGCGGATHLLYTRTHSTVAPHIIYTSTYHAATPPAMRENGPAPRLEAVHRLLRGDALRRKIAQAFFGHARLPQHLPRVPRGRACGAPVSRTTASFLSCRARAPLFEASRNRA